jgi:tRNA(Arg) A34 adenosine deaminase TadA
MRDVRQLCACIGGACVTRCVLLVRCAMALLHSRVRRVIYGARNTDFGGLGSRVKVHQNERLNHRYSVYAGAAELACERLRPPPGA